MVVIGDLRQEHDLVRADRPAIGDLESENVAVERDHLVDVVDVHHGVSDLEAKSVRGEHRNLPEGSYDDSPSGKPTISTVPAAPSTRTSEPLGIRCVPSTVPTTDGNPISRPMIAACDAKLP